MNTVPGEQGTTIIPATHIKVAAQQDILKAGNYKWPTKLS